MSQHQRHIKSLSNTTYEEPYATISEPTNATFITAETVETDPEKTGLRSASQDVHAERELAEDTETEGQAQTSCAVEVVEGEAVGLSASRLCVVI
jgi:hypothetical protein